MAYYQKVPQKRGKTNYAEQGSWDEEGTHYRNKPGRKAETASAEEKKASVRRTGKYIGEQKTRINYGSDRMSGNADKNSVGKEKTGLRRRTAERFMNDQHRSPESCPRATEKSNTSAGYRELEYQSKKTRTEEKEIESDRILCGRNPIREALRSGREIEKLLVQKGDLSGSAREIVQEAREKKIMIQEVDKRRLDEIALHHQGLIAFANEYHYAEVDEMLQDAAAKGEDPFLIILDGVTDPHNLGAIIRTAECAGAHGVIIPLHRSVGLTPTAVKASAGAIEHMKVSRVTNLNRTIDELKRNGIWVYAVTMDGKDYEKVDFHGGTALVIGAEGEGISRLTAEKCDLCVSLPMKGSIDSLNASVAAGIVMYRVLHCRKDR